MVEAQSEVSATTGEALATLRGVRRELLGSGARIMGAGLHPNAAPGEADVHQTRRYAFIEDSLQGVLRTPICGQHIHVGMPDADTAIRVFNGIRSHLPLLLALSANSPLWFGIDSGLASARFPFVRAYPRRGVPRAFRDLDDYADTIAAVSEAGDLADYTYVWWDVRLHPRLGTIELREIDAQSRIGDTAAIAALVQALARHEAEQAREPDPPEAIAESSFRASRDGTDATLLHDGVLRPVREVAMRTLERVSPHVSEFGGEPALAGIDRLLDEGGGAGRQRAALQNGGMEALLEHLVNETAQPHAPPG
jgi:carboxylate-amine ligase